MAISYLNNDNQQQSPPVAHYGRHPIHDRAQRPLQVIVIGAGPSGIAMLIELLKIPFISVRCFEKNADVGGTWLETRYPGAACDVASHAYQYSFDSKTDWSRHFAPAEEIGDYFRSVAKKHGLYSHIAFGSRVTSAEWNEHKAQWKIQVEKGNLGATTETFVADVLINAGGILNDWAWPEIHGLDSFQGHRVHTAAWDSAIDLKNKSVAVIGSGASSIQVVPSIQHLAKKVDVYVRSPTYILPTVGFGVESSTFNEPYTESQIQRFSSDTAYYKQFRKRIEQQMNENFSNSKKASSEQFEGRLWAENMMKKAIASPELQQKLIPSWELGCRRLTPGLPYLNAVQQPNVNVIRDGIKRIIEKGIETDDNQLIEADVIICATGFITSFSSRFNIVGRHNRTLKEMWKERGAEAYLGTAIAGLPNYYTLLGPNCPIANGSLVPCIESSVKYIVQILDKMQRDQIKSLEIRKEVQDSFNEYVQEVHKDLVWTGSCNSWYRDRSTGRVTAVWPGSSIHFMEMIETPRWEHFEIRYVHPNPFAFMGNGICLPRALS
ncbi:hypothetical protein EDB81DRAFT_864441 [Dactylonectria macrodidyma]|uniref:Uncharacterized protein n=1 Tax=Dactylonectria macrodidyma TaxID=307937 RepID=A0A9P9FMY0_9HYPO|nr:hypothetical protein EDB81DRAFT_864441 [Dactylonectria macrodidyma]